VEFLLDVNPEKEGQSINVKKEIYRLSSLLVNNMANVCLIPAQYTTFWERLLKIYETGILSSEAYENLKVALSLAVEMRLRTYAYYQKQTEMLVGSSSGVQKLDDIGVLFALPNSAPLFRYYITVLPLAENIERFWKDVLAYSAIN